MTRRRRRSGPRLGALHHERVPRGARRRRVPPARRPDRRADPGAEGRRGRDVRRRDRGRVGLRGRDVRVRHPPGRGARHHAGRQGALRARGGHPRRPRDLGLPRSRRGRRSAPPATSARKALYLDEMGRPLADRDRPRRRAGRRRPRLLRRPQGRPHVDQRHQRRRHQDVVRAVLPPHAHRTPGRGRRGRVQPARAGLQREGRGPALARQAEPLLRRRGRRRVGDARRRARRRSRRVRFWAPARRRSRRRRRPRHRRTPRGRRRVQLDAARVRRRGLPAVPVHRRERREEPDPVHPRTRAVAAEAVRGRRRGHAGRGRAPRSARRAGRELARPAGPGAGRANGSSPTCSRSSTRSASSSSPEDGSRARLGVERPRAWPARSPRSCAGCTPAPRGWGSW